QEIRAQLKEYPITYVDPDRPTLPLFLEENDLPEKGVLLTYYSPRDLIYAFGWTAGAGAIIHGNLRQRGSLSGRVGHLAIKDPYGWSRESLAKFAAALGIDSGSKELISPEEKAHMWDVLLARPEDFIKYVIGDVTLLHRIHDRFVGLVSQIQR